MIIFNDYQSQSFKHYLRDSLDLLVSEKAQS